MILVFVAVVIVIGVYGAFFSLQTRFQKLGNLEGLTLEQIEEEVGKPNAVSAMNNGILVQWMENGYHIALLFKDNKCVGITHESMV